MRTFTERRQLARETGNRVATEARYAIPDYRIVMQQLVDYILTETEGTDFPHTKRLAAYHELLNDLTRLVED
jgi:hypothetical protein